MNNRHNADVAGFWLALGCIGVCVALLLAVIYR